MNTKSGQRVLITIVSVVGLLAFSAVRKAVAEQTCVSISQASADSVYDQALSTVRVLTQEALRAKRNGSWRPDGSFAQPFFNKAGRSLREIRSLLEESSSTGATVSRAALLEAFDQIFEVSFPRGLRQLARLQRGERRKFIAEIDALPSIMSECAG